MLLLAGWLSKKIVYVCWHGIGWDRLVVELWSCGFVELWSEWGREWDIRVGNFIFLEGVVEFWREF